MKAVFLLLVCCPLVVMANFTPSAPDGFHWYTHPATPSVTVTPRTPREVTSTTAVTQLSPSQTLHLLTQHTRDTMATALLNPTVANTAKYMQAQQFWQKQDQRFVRAWQEALLLHPELDYTLRFPTDNNAIPVRNDERKLLIEHTLASMATQDGLVFFYRGNSSVCQKFASILLPFVQQYHFAMISVTTDNTPIVGLPNPKAVSAVSLQHRLGVKARYLPALFLINLHTHQLQALSYGFISTDSLKQRFLDVRSQFARYSFNGLGERTQ